MDGLCFLGRGPIDLSVETGECITLTGASGSGKTLLLRAIADLDRHTGDVFVRGDECASVDAPEWRRRVGLLPAESQWWRDSVGEHLEDVDVDWLGRLGFGREVLDWSVSRLSTGERQRLALLRLMANRPEVLLLDEATANLDSQNTLRAEALIADYRTESAAAVLWVTHDPAQARRVGSRRFRVQNGRLTEEWTE